MDSSGRYLMQQEFGWAFDLGLGGWIHFLNAPQKITHLFWHTDWLKRDWIYSITPTPDANATYHVYRSEAYPYSGYELCTVKNVKLASGHEFPHVFFYHTKKSEKGPMLSLWELDVRTCKVAMRSEFKDPIVGNVLAVHRLEPLNSIAVAVDHPRKNLLWYQASKGCNYYESGGLLPMVPSRNFPVIAVWSSNKGLGLIFPDDEKRASVLGGAAIEELRSQDIALSNTGKELFISARPNGETFKLLLSVKIN